MGNPEPSEGSRPTGQFPEGVIGVATLIRLGSPAAQGYRPVVESLGKWLVIAGLVLVALGGLLWWSAGRQGFGSPLPGDLVIRRGNSTVYFPWVSCLVVSILLSLLFRLFNR